MKYCCSFLLLLLFGISGGFAQDKVECWGRYEISLPAKVKGNPFDIELTATFSGPDTTLTVRGFYDGNDTFKIRFMPVSQGVWSYVTQSEIPVQVKKWLLLSNVTIHLLFGPVHVKGSDAPMSGIRFHKHGNHK